MTLKRAIIIVVLTGIIFSGIGGVVGWMLGTYSPEYYRTIFQGENDPDFDSVQMGLSLGLMQGLGAGVAVAVGIILLLVWRESFKARLEQDPDVGYISAARSRAGFWIVLWCIVLLLSVGFCSTVAFVVGGLMGQQQLYQRETFHKLDKIDEILKSGGYPGVRTESSSAAQVYLTGSVKDQATHDGLRNELVLKFGTEEADFMIQGVDVKP